MRPTIGVSFLLILLTATTRPVSAQVIFEALKSFDTNERWGPLGRLAQASDGWIYGLTDGIGPCASAFRFEPSDAAGTFETLWLGGQNGADCYVLDGGLVQAWDGNLYFNTTDNGQVWRPRIQSYDSTFGTRRTDRICLHANSIKKCYGNLRGNPLFDDTASYWVAPNPAIGHFGWASVPLPGFGVTIRVNWILGEFMEVKVAPK